MSKARSADLQIGAAGKADFGTGRIYIRRLNGNGKSDGVRKSWLGKVRGSC
jgi:hypothetical protein